MLDNHPPSPPEARPGSSRLLQAAAVLFLIWCVVSLLLSLRPGGHDLFRLVPLDMTAVEHAAGVTGVASSAPINSVFDAQGFPVSASPDPVVADDQLAGRQQILAYLQAKAGAGRPDEILKSFEGKFGRYWKDPRREGFLEESRARSLKLNEMANRNRQLVQSVNRFLQSDAGKAVSAALKGSLSDAIESPARNTLHAAFSAWKNGDLAQAYQLLKQAESLDSRSAFIQIMAHQAMAFLNQERHGPLEETLRQYRDLADETHQYLSRFRPVFEKAGFDPVKLYGRDPFDARGLPTSEQFEKAMNQSRYVQFERA